jgi:uncharacterized protein
MTHIPDSPELLESLSRLYERIDARATHLLNIHANRLHCGLGCADCCIDDISVSEVEVLNIQHYCGDLLRKIKPHPEGACAFLAHDNSCRIYKWRPYVCRTQGLPLHWLEEEGGKTIAFRDICPHNESGAPIEELPENECWKIGPVEEELAKLQIVITKGTIKRVRLRDLFSP